MNKETQNDIDKLEKELKTAIRGGAPDYILREIREDIDRKNGINQQMGEGDFNRKYMDALFRIKEQYPPRRAYGESRKKIPKVSIGSLLVDIALGDNDISITRESIVGCIKRPFNSFAEKIRLLKEKRELLARQKEANQGRAKRM